MTDTYALVQTLASPLVAITSLRGDEPNGMIANSACRASLSATHPRVSTYIHKFNYSHDTIYRTARFVMHVLHADQLSVVYALGFSSRRDGDKLRDVPHHPGDGGLPILDDCHSYFECEVINAMDTGSSTLFLGAATAAQRGPGFAKGPMTAQHFRNHVSPERRTQYLENLEAAQAHCTRLDQTMRPVVWPGLSSPGSG